VIASAAGFAGGLAATYLARAIAWRLGIVARPNPIVPQHQRSVAYLGGIAIALGAAIASALGALPVSPWFALGAVGYVVFGTYDDLRPLPPLAKLLGQLALALVAGHGAGPLGVAWIVVVVNAVNLTDVCDGLVASLAIPALIAVGIATSEPMAFALAAATAGFLWFNRAPATIFLGDGGSHLLGFAIAWLWLAAPIDSWHRAAAALLGAGVFVLELGFLVIVRHRRGLPFWRGSPDHLALRLQAAGHSKRATVAIALVPAVLFDALAIWLARRAALLATAIAAISVVIAIAAIARLYALEPVPKRGRAREVGDP